MTRVQWRQFAQVELARLVGRHLGHLSSLVGQQMAEGGIGSHDSGRPGPAAGQDLVDHLYTPIITIGDPLFDFTDSGAGPVPGGCDFSTQGTNIGWASQGLFSPACLFVGVDKVEVACGGACPDGNSFLFGLPGDLWIHSWVKNSPLTVASVMQYVTS
ncbi:MAG TPA: hypothetical protein VGS19_23180 [Streptosporangiaceae bacterium]|nr:hypothetical protein [Streptosporangiaceae bacterium]